MNNHRSSNSTGGVYDGGGSQSSRSSRTSSRSIATPTQPLTTSTSSTGSDPSVGGEGEDELASKVFSTSYCPSLAGYHPQAYVMRAVNKEGFLDVLAEGWEDRRGGSGGAKEAGSGGNGMEWKTRYCILKEGALSVYMQVPLRGREGGGMEGGDEE